MSEPLRLRHFREFASAIGGLKRRAKEETLETLRAEVMQLLDLQERLDERRDPDYHYALAAFADETFLGFDWPGRAGWRARLVETQRFGSRAAGERVFTRIDELIESDRVAGVPMAAVYLMMTGLGFRGRYRLAVHESEIYQRRARLRAIVERRSPELLANGRMAPEAYAHTIQEGPVATLASPARWWAAAALVVLLWAASSTYAWFDLTGTLTTRIQKVERALAEGSR